jgi:hypothetical protein
VYYSGGHYGHASACSSCASSPSVIYESEGKPTEVEKSKEGAEKLPKPDTKTEDKKPEEKKPVEKKTDAAKAKTGTDT